MAPFRSMLAPALLAVLSACSPYDYSKAVGALDSQVKALDDSVTAPDTNK